jgi:hypothetical protein
VTIPNPEREPPENAKPDICDVKKKKKKKFHFEIKKKIKVFFA